MIRRMMGAATAVLLAGPATATTFFEEKFTCPVGGKPFSSRVMGSNSYFGSRPDGRPYSPTPVEPLIECPDNGFILYKRKFSRDEIRVAKRLVASADYIAMLTSETPYYRLWWLQREMGEPIEAQAGALLVASWETDGDAARKARYQVAFVEAVAAFGPNTDARARSNFSVRAANALRELGQFDEAGALLASAAKQTADLANEEERTALTSYISSVRALVAEKVKASEPVTMIPEQIAIFPCVIVKERLATIEQAVCDTPALQKQIAQTRMTSQNGEELTGEDAVRYMARNLADTGPLSR